MEQKTNINTTQTQLTPQEWIEIEEQELLNCMGNIEMLPYFKMDEKKIYEIQIDFSKPFERFDDKTNKTVKKIIPVRLLKVDNTEIISVERFNWWLNCKNPVYKEILAGGKKGQTKFRIIRTGQQQETKYTILG